MTTSDSSHPNDHNQPSLTYADAGVDIEAGNELVERIKPDIKRTHRPGVLGGLGGFGGLFELPDNYQKPVLVSGTDGVGTKLLLANHLNDHSGIGIDLVAMCVNDILVCGAEPLFFLDYYACGKLDLQKSQQIIAGIAEGCVQAGAALIGGETAEMPGMYDSDDYDLAGFSVGVVEKDRLLDKAKVKAGDSIIGLTSSGFHSNGYSLIRKVIDSTDIDINTICPEGCETTIAQSLMAPTQIYVKPVLELLQQIDVHALAHITGGGITENVPRSLPANTMASIDASSWLRPDIFNWVQQTGNIADSEMLKTFNCGIGMVVIVPAAQQHETLTLFKEQGQTAMVIGEVAASNDTEATVHWL